jgi:hypothetical protein
MFKNYLNRRNVEHDPIGDPNGGDPRLSRTRKLHDPVTAAISVGGSLIGGAISSNAATSAAKTQADAAKDAQAQQERMFQTLQTQQAPARATGYQALNTLGSMLPGYYQQYDALGNPVAGAIGSGELTRPFTAEDLKTNLAPNYQFMLGQGTTAARMGTNAGGGGSNVNIAGTKFAEDYASNAYQNAFNNFQTQQTNIYNRLAGVAGIGQQAQAGTNTAAGNYINAATGLTTGGAAATAGGTVGSANALAGTLGNASGNYTLYSLLNQNPSLGVPGQTTYGTQSPNQIAANQTFAANTGYPTGF